MGAVMAGKQRVARLLVLVVAVAAAAAAVLGVAFAPLMGNSHANQHKTALMSLPFWLGSCVLVWWSLRRSLLVGTIGAVIAVVGALVVLSDPSLRDDGLGGLLYVGMPIVVMFGEVM